MSDDRFRSPEASTPTLLPTYPRGNNGPQRIELDIAADSERPGRGAPSQDSRDGRREEPREDGRSGPA